LRNYLRFAAIAPLLGFLWAQQPAPENTDTTIFRSESRLVVLHATAEDKEGHLVKDLPQTAFQVFENGVRQDIKEFRQEDVPVSLGLVIDSSASMTNKRDRVAAAALALVNLSNPDDEVFIVNFDETPSLDVDYTNDQQRLKKGLARIDSRGGTAMRDAVRTAVEHLKGRDKKDKKVLLVVTDGADNSSVEPIETVIRAAQQSDVLIYAIGLLGEESPRETEKAKRALDALTRATGGQNYYPKDVSEVAEIAPRIAHEIRNQYTVAYIPSNQELDGSYRQIKVVVSSPAVASVRTRSGYYASTESKRMSSNR
jgi:VWFA-related protein